MTDVDMVAVTSGGDTEGDAPKEEKKSASTQLVEIAEQMYEFGLGDNGEVFATPRDGDLVVRMLRGGKTSLRAQLAREYFMRTRKAAPSAALADALLVIEGMAQLGQEQELHLRVARHGGALWLDLGDVTGRAVRITRSGWTVAERAPVLFKRTALNGCLPDPERGGSLAELWGWLNVVPDDRPLVAAWLVSTMFADMPHPVLGLLGEQGTGKTTAEKVLVSILDPGPVPTRKPPRDADSWVTAASGSWVVGLDNLSDMPAWLSDSICRAVTGDGDVRRRLYTDADMAVFAFRRCIVLNGIDLGALRGDLAERLLPITLETIAEADRIEEEQLWPRWTQVHPRMLGAVLDLAAGVVAALPSVHLERKPRMADFARVLAAVDTVMCTDGLSRYLAKQRETATDSLTGDVFMTAVADHLAGNTFLGTAGELLAKVTPPDEKWRAPKGWPTTARKVTTRLRRQAPVARKAGWTLTDDGGKNKFNAVRWTITPPEDSASQDSPSSPDSSAQVEAPSGSELHQHAASQASHGERVNGEPGELEASHAENGNSPLTDAVASENTIPASKASKASHKHEPPLQDVPVGYWRDGTPVLPERK